MCIRDRGCEMKDKFRENFWIALPAALAALALILVISFRQAPGTPIVQMCIRDRKSTATAYFAGIQESMK